MGADQHHDWRAAAVSALAWWHEAGVDTLVEEGPCDWFAAPPAVSARAAITPEPPRTIPDDLAGFLAWRAGPDAPEAGWRSPLAPATGSGDGTVMVLVDCADREDGAALLSADPAGGLFDRMLAAIGLSRDAIQLAAVHWRRPPPGRTPEEIERRLGELARRHVALSGARRVLLLGDAASRAVLGTNILNARGGLRAFNHEGARAQVVASLHPRLLVERPAMKAEAWRDLQLLTGGMDE